MDWDDSIFSPPEADDPYGYVGWSYKVEPGMLRDAYRHGVFPWPETAQEILWFSPPERGGLHIGSFRIPHGTVRELKKKQWHLRVDTVFDQVIDECAAASRPGQPGTWITPEMRRGYKEFHRAGFAHSFETFDENGQLIGGLYGVLAGAVFCGESMFFKESGASKFALANMFAILQKSGVEFVDTQMVTPTLAMFGAVEISREEYWKILLDFRDADIVIESDCR